MDGVVQKLFRFAGVGSWILAPVHVRVAAKAGVAIRNRTAARSARDMASEAAERSGIASLFMLNVSAGRITR